MNLAEPIIPVIVQKPINEYICEKCGKVFKKQCNLYTHLKRKRPCVEVANRGAEDVPPKCDMCNKDFSTKSSLTRHKKVCKQKKAHANSDNSEILKRLARLERELEETKKQLAEVSDKTPTQTNITNVINNINNTNNGNMTNITIIGDYKNPDMTGIAFDKALMDNAKNYCDIHRIFIERIYFNENYPKNFSITMANDAAFVVRDNEEWKKYGDANAKLDFASSLSGVMRELYTREFEYGQLSNRMLERYGNELAAFMFDSFNAKGAITIDEIEKIIKNNSNKHVRKYLMQIPEVARLMSS
jgi:hypothetical protein